jgi:hypothetical protein
MRSIDRVETSRRLSDPVSEGRRIEHVRTNRDILGETDARRCHRPGDLANGGCIMVSLRLALARWEIAA